MGRETPPSLPLPPPQPPSSEESYLPMLYYGLVIAGTAAILLAVYNLIIIRWCSQEEESESRRRSTGFFQVATIGRRNLRRSNRELLSSFKYKKDNIDGSEQDQGSYSECPVCLSAFEEGEEVRQLPRCKHSFHVACIDMWLHSHSDCPLCRTQVDLPKFPCRRNTTRQSNEDLIHYGMAI